MTGRSGRLVTQYNSSFRKVHSRSRRPYCWALRVSWEKREAPERLISWTTTAKRTSLLWFCRRGTQRARLATAVELPALA
jgi:hypothetical protein